jgi:glycosyltransferase involved in cell wall biosynthesis
VHAVPNQDRAWLAVEVADEELSQGPLRPIGAPEASQRLAAVRAEAPRIAVAEGDVSLAVPIARSLGDHPGVSSEAAERRPTPHFESGRGGERPRGIVLHTTDGSAESASSWFAHPDSGVSAHYLVRLDGGLVQFVEEADTARHAGRIRAPTTTLARGDPNRHTIGIEFEDGGKPGGVERPAAQYRTGARLIREVAARWNIALDRRHVVGHREIFAAKSCPGNLDVDRLVREARESRIVCLVPARNAAADLPEFLDSAARFCDAVVALDDGSTDGTPEVLAEASLVGRVLSNPPRRGWRGWDDGANRRRLLAAAGSLDPAWVVFVDTDERLDAPDARALRELVEEDALRGCAYSLRHFRMWGADLCDPRFDHVYRLFAYRPDLVLPERRLHFNPVPTDIPRAAWVKTTIRLKHYAAADERHRAARLAKYREVDPDGVYGTNFGRLAEQPDEGRLIPWAPRPERLPALEVAAAAPDSSLEHATGPARKHGQRLVCLLPARNCAEEISGWLETVRRFADVVVGLDDGSSDGTAEVLERDPLVGVLLRNPQREGSSRWDDSANRQRLLEAAAELEPDWVIQLDADERIDAQDAAALRRFVEHEARRGEAYGFRVFRMVGPDIYDRADLWVYRLFPFEPGQLMPRARLHFVPIPTSIPRERWQKTTFRIQHFSSVSEERRAMRLAKYLEADPRREFQGDYSALLEPPGPPRRWQSRPPGFPALADPHGTGDELDLFELDLDAPVLSAVIISRNDQDRIERSVRSVVEQECPHPFEVIVVVSGEDRTADIVRERFPEVRLVELEGVALPGRARNAGLAVARGEYISFPGSHVELPPGSLAARVAAHELGHSMVTGSLVNGTHTPAGWAAYFLDHAGALPGRPSGSLQGPPAHCSYRRELLVEAGGFSEDMRAGEDTVVNKLLFERGHSAYRAQEIQLVHRNRCERPPRLVAHHFTRGRAMGRILRADRRAGRLSLSRLLGSWLIHYIPSRLRRTSASVAGFGNPQLRRRYRSVYPLVVAGAISAWAGIWTELLTGRARAGVR